MSYALLTSRLRNLHYLKSWRYYSMVSSKMFNIYFLHLGLQSTWNLFWFIVWGKGQNMFFFFFLYIVVRLTAQLSENHVLIYRTIAYPLSQITLSHKCEGLSWMKVKIWLFHWPLNCLLFCTQYFLLRK